MAPKASTGNSAIVVLGKWLEAKYEVSCGEHSAFGGVHGTHKPNSHHYEDEALDVNHDQGNESGVLNEIYDLLSADAGAYGIVELFFEARGIPTPVEEHDDHLHVAIEGPPTDALLKLVAEFGGKSLSGVPEALGGGVDAVTNFGKDKAGELASGVVAALLNAIGADGARILLYVALVVGGAVLVYYGTARAAGMQRPIATPVGLAVMKGKA